MILLEWIGIKPEGNQGKSGNATNVPFPTKTKDEQTFTHEGKHYTYYKKGSWIRSEPEVVVAGTRRPQTNSEGPSNLRTKAGCIGVAAAILVALGAFISYSIGRLFVRGSTESFS